MSKKNKIKLDIGGKFNIVDKFAKATSVASCCDYFTWTEPSYKTVYIKRVIYNNPATIVFWNDGTKTVAKCSTNDNFNYETGLSICCLKKLSGSSNIKKLFRDWIPENGNIFEIKNITIRDLRLKNKIKE